MRCVTICALLLNRMLKMKNAATLATLLSALSMTLAAAETQRKPATITRKAA